MKSYRGVDPDGLIQLAAATVAAARNVRGSASTALRLLDRNGFMSEVVALAAADRRLDVWANETADDLRWRSKTITTGQNARLSIESLLRARFAAEAVFTTSSREAAYREWLSEWHRRERRIASVVSDITDWLSQGISDWDVTNTDLHNIRLALEGLTSEEMDRVIRRMSPTQLERWIVEMGNSFNGFSRREKQEVFALLAANLSGAALSKVHDAILDGAGEEEIADFGRAIRAWSEDGAIVEFVAEAIARDLTSHRFSALAPALAVAGIEDGDSAAAVTSVIVHTDRALGALSVDSLIHNSSGAGFRELIAVLAQGDAADQTVVFAALASIATNRQGVLTDLIEERRTQGLFTDRRENQLDAQLAEDARHHAMEAAIGILELDPGATILGLARDVDPAGSMTASFWHLMVECGQAESIASILNKLRRGTQVDLVVFSYEGTDPSYRYPNAQNLAFAAATLNRGLTAAAGDAKGDIDAIVRITAIATAILGFVVKGAELTTSLVGAGADWTVAERGEDVKDDIDDQLADLIETVSRTLRPTDEHIADPPSGLGGAMTAWTNRYTGLLPFA